jgi:hypothetical protein
MKKVLSLQPSNAIMEAVLNEEVQEAELARCAKAEDDYKAEEYRNDLIDHDEAYRDYQRGEVAAINSK